jgi:F0F1-type ATP synthase epsilon subunit
MVTSNGIKFECRQCGGNELGYQKYAKCMTPVSLLENGHVEYNQSIIDEDDYLAILNGFACRSCGSLIEHCGLRIQTEKELIDYLSMDHDVRQQQQSEYEEHMSAQSDEQERKEIEQALCDQEITDMPVDNG